MKYMETDACRDLPSLKMPFFRTGSREICRPAPMKTDVDFVVLDILCKGGFEDLGFVCTNEDDANEYGEADFITYRNGEVNLIVVDEWPKFKAWKAATKAAKAMNITDKSERIKLFQGVLYGNW